MKARNKTNKFLKLTAAALLTVGLAGCGGGGGGETSPGSTDKSVSGTLISPDTAQATATKSIRKYESAEYRNVNCSNVPDGYSPLANIVVSFLDDAGNELKDTTTDECGVFDVFVPGNVTQIKVFAGGFEDIIVDVSTFTLGPGHGNVVSAVPVGAKYQIASIQKTADNKLAFTVTDSITNKAIIGIPPNYFYLTKNGRPLPFSDISSAAVSVDPASVVLVLDASGSMYDTIIDAAGNDLLDQNGNPYTKMRMSAIASHTYLNGVDVQDETGFVAFDHIVNFINDQQVADIFTLQDASGNPAQYMFSASGFASDTSKLRFVVDAYNAYTKLWAPAHVGFDENHPDTPNLKILGTYPWGGATAMYDAMLTGIEKVKGRSNSRKIVVAMSDGLDNRSSGTEADVIAAAQASGVAVHTLSYGEATNKLTLENIASATNASFFDVDGVDITGAFQGIQTGITYQYLGTLSDNVASGDVLVLTLSWGGGQQTSRELIVQ